MTLLLVAASGLLLLSGLVKLRAWSRVSRGVHLFPLLEIAAGLVMGAAVATGAPAPGLGLALVLGAVALVIASSLLLGTELRRMKRDRERSEGARLETYVKYLSGPPRID